MFNRILAGAVALAEEEAELAEERLQVCIIVVLELLMGLMLQIHPIQTSQWFIQQVLFIIM